MRWAAAAEQGAGGRRSRPGKRWGHSLTAVDSGKLLFYLFGGYGTKCQTSDVHVFDPVKESWSKPLVKGTLPAPRDSHTCTAVGSELFVFGGTDGTRPLDDLYVLDTATSTWTKPDTSGEIPSAREGHGAALVGDDLFVFGGCGRQKENQAGEVFYDDLYALSTTSRVWRRVETSGSRPCSRDSHSLSTFGNKLVVFGGEDTLNTYLADVYIFNVDSREWSRLETSGVKPAPRAGHAAQCIGHNLIVFGGFSDKRAVFDDVLVLNLLSGEWSKPVLTGDGPSRRFSFASDLLDADNGVVACYGGCNQELEALPGMYYLHTGEDPGSSASTRQQVHAADDDQSLRTRGITRQATRLSAPSDFGRSDPEPAASKRPKPSERSEPAAGKKMFQAKLTNVFHYGYTLQARIDGKPFRGVLFSYKPGFTDAVLPHIAAATPRLELDAAGKAEPPPHFAPPPISRIRRVESMV